MAGESLSLRDLTQQMQEMREQLVLAQAELTEAELTGTAGGGLVTVTMRGNGEVVNVVFDQAALDEGDAESLARLTLTAIRHATDAVRSLATERVGTATSDLRAAMGSRGFAVS
ncbi:MAG TPA: YbaB/EbfC family nucleoid-associated protein [Micromonosporaceae bacterium]